MRRYLFSLSGLMVLFFVHKYGITGSYVTISWLDIVAHLLAAGCIGLFVFAVLQSLWPAMSYKSLLAVILTILAGLSWEYMEIHYNITGHPLWSRLYYLDTTQDVVMDTLGPILSVYLFNKYDR